MQPDTSSENNVLTKWRCPAPKLAIKTLTFSILYGTQVLPFCSAYFNEDGYCALHWCLTTNCSWSHKTGHVVSCDPNHESHYKLLLYFFSKKITSKIDQKSLLQTAISIFLIGSYCLTKLDCYDLLLHDVTGDYKIIGFRGFIVGPKA